MSASNEKQYGLILPGQNKAVTKSLGTRKLNPLCDSDDELEKDEDAPLNWVEESLKKSAGNSGQQNLQKRLLREALEEDSSIFQYDEIYDEMQATKAAKIETQKQATDKQPKYIHTILKHAEKRKLENERRTERTVQKEREAEGDEYADKESFVTASYLKKMEELKMADAKEKFDQIMEERNDVMKHKNFGVFYSHLFKQKMGDLEVKKEPEDEDKNIENKAIKKVSDNIKSKNYRSHRDLSESPDRKMEAKPRKKNEAPRPLSRKSSGSDSDEHKAESYRERRDKAQLKEKKDTGKHEKDVVSEKRTSGRSKERDRHHRSPNRQKREQSSEKNRSNMSNERIKRDRFDDRDKGNAKSSDKSKRERSSNGRHDYDKAHSKRHRSRSPHRSHRKRSLSKDKASLSKDKVSLSKDKASLSKDKVSLSKDIVVIKEEEKSPVHSKSGENDKVKNSTVVGKSDDQDKAQKLPMVGKSDHDKFKNDVKHHDVKIKQENELDEKQKHLERIQKLFTKRTVGERFDQALERYQKRKAERGL